MIELILRPSDFQDAGDWQRSVIDSVKQLVGADMGGIMMATGSGQEWVSDYPPARLIDYGIRFEEVVPDVDVWSRHAELGVHQREDVWLPICPDFYETAYYRDFLRPLRAFDSLGATWYRGSSRRSDTVCQLLLHHGSESGPRFGQRERELIELMVPALRSASEHLFFGLTRVDETLDALPVPTVLLDGTFRILHLNPAARTYDSLIGAGGPFVEAAAQNAVRESATGGAAQERVHRLVRSAAGMAELHLSRISLGGSQGSGWVVTFRAVSEEPSCEALTSVGLRMGLTPRQAEVATLMTGHLSSREISKRLDISPHTARRHEEAVLRGLGVHRRGDVLRALSGSQVGGPKSD